MSNEEKTLEECGIQNRSKLMVMARAKRPEESKQAEPEEENKEEPPPEEEEPVRRPAFSKDRLDSQGRPYLRIEDPNKRAIDVNF